MKILLTGGAGYIGSVTTDLLLEKEHDVVVIDTLERGYLENVNPKARFIQGNIGDVELLKEIFVSEKPEVIMHFAGYIAVAESVQKPDLYFENNEKRASVLAEEALKAKITKIIFSSTAAVYGEPQIFPITEEDETKPVNPYGQSKLNFEKRLLALTKQGMQYIALRYFNACGATERVTEKHDPETHLIPNLLAVARGEKEYFALNGLDYPTPDGSCIRDFVHVYDIAQAHLVALDELLKEKQQPFELAAHAYNISLGKGFSVREVMTAAEKVTGKKIPFKDVGRRAGDPARLVADPKRIQGLGWEPKYTSTEEIIASAWKKS